MIGKFYCSSKVKKLHKPEFHLQAIANNNEFCPIKKTKRKKDETS